MKASEMLKMVLCDQTGEVSINGSREDLRILKAAIEKVEETEHKLDKYIQISRR